MFRLTFKPSSVCESTFDVQIGSVNNVKHPKHIRMSHGGTRSAARAVCAREARRGNLYYYIYLAKIVIYYVL